MRNWKTTLIGVGLGFLHLWANGLQPKQAAVAIGMATLGALAKDYDVTGVR